MVSGITGIVAVVAVAGALFALSRPGDGPAFVVASGVRARCAGAQPSYSSDSLGAIAVGPDKALWFAEPSSDSDKVGRLTTAGRLSEYCLPASESISDLAAGPDGAIWAMTDDYQIERVTPTGKVSAFRLLPWVDASGQSLGIGPGRTLWATTAWAASVRTTTGWVTGEVGNIFRLGLNGAGEDPEPSWTPMTPAPPRDARVGYVHASGPFVVGPDGALWFTGYIEIPEDPARYKSEYDIGIVARETGAGKARFYEFGYLSIPGAIVVGPDRALWFVSEGQEGSAWSIGRITTAGARSSFALPPLPGDAGRPAPASLVAAPDGAIWFVSGFYAGRIDMAGHVSYRRVVARDGFADGTYHRHSIVLGPDGALWATMSGGKVARIGLDGATTEYGIDPRAQP